jgi:hypothetical protein
MQHDLVTNGNCAFTFNPGHQPALVARQFRELPSLARMMRLDNISHLTARRVFTIDDQRGT